MKRAIVAGFLALAFFFGMAAVANAASPAHLKSSPHSSGNVLVTFTDGVARYLSPGSSTTQAKSYYVLSGTSVYDFHMAKCYNAGTRVYLWNGTRERVIIVRPWAC